MSENLKLLKNGFTLLELLIVVAVIGVLAGFILVSYPGAQKQARDSQRRSDIKQYQTLLESYSAINSDLYPSRTSNTRPDTLCPNPIGPTTCPRDPSTPTYEYYYRSNGSGGAANDATIYVIWSYQQKTSDYFIVCNSGRVGTSASAPASANCPI